MNIEKIFDYARENNISDIHLLEGEKIYFRKDGEIKEMGTHSELITMNGIYKNLYDIQFNENM